MRPVHWLAWACLVAAVAACAPPPRPAPPAAIAAPAAGGPLKLAAWNLEWLMTPEAYAAMLPRCDPRGQPRSHVRSFPCTPERGPPPKRETRDFAALARYASALDADVVALSEVDGPEAAALVFRSGYVFDCFVARAHPQKTGFAIRRGLPYRCNAELAALDLEGTTRAGADMTLFPGTVYELRLLSVHLVSGCFQERLDQAGNPACAALRRQVPVLARWVDERASEGVAFALLGDFNRRLEVDARYGPGPDPAAPLNLFYAVSDGFPLGASVRRATERQAYVPCSAADRFDGYVDNILVGVRLAMRAGTTTFQHLRYAEEDARAHRLSDHCPIALTLDHAGPGLP